MDAAKINVRVSFQQILEAVKQLTPKERLQLNDAIWREDTPIPVEHQRIVMDRIKEARENPETMLDWDEVSKNW